MNVQFKDHKEINNNNHLCFPFIIRTFSDLASFSIFFQDDQNKKIVFHTNEKNIYRHLSHIMVKNYYNFRNQQKIKDEQINYLLGDLEKNLEDYKAAIEIKEKKLDEAKRIVAAAKQSFDKVAQENRDLKAYIENLKQHFQKQQTDFLNQQRAFYSKKKYT